MSARQARREAAEARRRDWKVRWCDLGKAEVVRGRSVREALEEVATEVSKQMTANPQLSSEIERALDEWLGAMKRAIQSNTAPFQS